MHPAYSVILFTVSSGAGYGLLAVLGISAATGQPLPASRLFCVLSLGTALGLITFGLLASTFHLGHPERAWRALTQWRSSWLSREGVAAILTYLPAGLFGLTWLLGWHGDTIWKALGALSAIGAIATVWCTAMIYRSLKTIRQWNNSLVVPSYLALAGATGLSLFAFLVGIFDQGRTWHNWIAFGTISFALTVKLLYWWTITREPRLHTIEAATGLGRRGVMRQIEAPHTQENFVQSEMGYRVGREHARFLRIMCLLPGLGFAGLMHIAAGFAQPTLAVVLMGGAVAALMMGALIERWLFFAEAKHVVNLFYGDPFA